jgi:hypothetical protein
VARRRPWPVHADDHRIAGVQHLSSIWDIADDLEGLTEIDMNLLRLAIARIKMHASDGRMHLTLAKYGEPLEDE